MFKKNTSRGSYKRISKLIKIYKLQMVLKRRSTIKTVQKSLFRVPMSIPINMDLYDDVTCRFVYENQDYSQDIAGYNTRLFQKTYKQ